MKKIKLTQNKFVIVDNEDYEYLNRWDWYLGNHGYATRKPWIKGSGGSKEAILMHRIITQCPKDRQVDHINRNKLDNRKQNLRLVTPQQQRFNIGRPMNNTSGYKGISWSNERKKWVAQIQINYKNISLGRFKEIGDAIFARKKAEKIYFKYT